MHGAFGVEPFTDRAVSRALETQVAGPDLVLGLDVEFAMGFAKPTLDIPMSPNTNSRWWGGAGGSTICVDTDAHVCMSYVKNQMDNPIVGDPRGTSLHQAVYASLEV